MDSFLTFDQVRDARQGISTWAGWGIDKPFNDESRWLLAQLRPPFLPEQEWLIFNPGVGNGGEIEVKEVMTPGHKYTRGSLFFATNARLIGGHVRKRMVSHIPYIAIRELYVEGLDFTLGLADGQAVVIKLSWSGPGISTATGMTMLHGNAWQQAMVSPTYQSERQLSAARAEVFLHNLAWFFYAITQINHRRRDFGKRS